MIEGRMGRREIRISLLFEVVRRLYMRRTFKLSPGVHVRGELRMKRSRSTTCLQLSSEEEGNISTGDRP